MCDFNASLAHTCTSGPRLSFTASIYRLLFFNLKGNDEDLSGNSCVTGDGGAWGSAGAPILHTAVTPSVWTLLTEMQLAPWSPALEQGDTQVLGLPSHLD